MIDALMYGMIPNAKMENCSKAPPENKLMSSKIVCPPCPEKNNFSLATLIPGVGINTPRRYTANIAIENSKRFLTSGILVRLKIGLAKTILLVKVYIHFPFQL